MSNISKLETTQMFISVRKGKRLDDDKSKIYKNKNR